jgi:uncharacterized membrane protein
VSELFALLTERPYVVAFLVTFLVVSGAERGWRRTLFWLASGAFLGWLMEFSSIRNGFPFGDYAYNEHNFPDEVWIGGVPLFASLSFAFLTYFGYSIACTFLSPVERRGVDIQRRIDPRIDGSLRVLLLAAAITTWSDTIVDPVAHLGKYWFLGDLYAYHGHGVHFDVPLTNYAGWLFTSVCIVALNQLFDAWLRGRERTPARGFPLPSKPLWALGTFFGNCAFMIGVTIYLLDADSVPASKPIGQLLASGVVLTAAFALFSALMLRRCFAREAPPEPANAMAVQET